MTSGAGLRGACRAGAEMFTVWPAPKLEGCESVCAAAVVHACLAKPHLQALLQCCFLPLLLFWVKPLDPHLQGICAGQKTGEVPLWCAQAPTVQSTDTQLLLSNTIAPNTS